jgi:hypothetical protein
VGKHYEKCRICKEIILPEDLKEYKGNFYHYICFLKLYDKLVEDDK